MASRARHRWRSHIAVSPSRAICCARAAAARRGLFYWIVGGRRGSSGSSFLWCFDLTLLLLPLPACLDMHTHTRPCVCVHAGLHMIMILRSTYVRELACQPEKEWVGFSYKARGSSWVRGTPLEHAPWNAFASNMTSTTMMVESRYSRKKEKNYPPQSNKENIVPLFLIAILWLDWR